MSKEVGIMTMGFNPWLKMHGVCNALDQTYSPKVLHLLHQAPFPPPIEHDGLIKIEEHHVEGEWPAVWYFKLATFLDACESPYFAIMDEDDRFEHEYLEKALAPIIAGAPLAWNLNNIIIKNRIDGAVITPLFKYQEYRSGIGALVGETSALRSAVKTLSADCQGGLTKGGGGPLDAILKRIISKVGVVEHDGLRCYFYHMNTGTKGDRDIRESIDYGWGRRIAPGKFRGTGTRRVRRRSRRK